MSPAIILIAWNRPHCFRRLLESVQKASYPADDIQLVISIDGGGAEEVVKMAEQFQWNYGTKELIRHPQNLGLKKHILLCGDLCTKYKAAVMLEEDLMVAPVFYEYALQSLDYYKEDENIAGISLYNYQVCENGFAPFRALDDGSDLYFMQIASSWGQALTSTQWQAFRKWQKEDLPDESKEDLPAYVQQWPETSWKKEFLHYLISQDRYFVFPRRSLSTNFGDPGKHSDRKGLFQVPLLQQAHNWKWTELKDSGSVYDAWFELKPEILNTYSEDLREYDYEMDLYGTKSPDQVDKEFLLTTSKAKKDILTFGLEMFPPELNVIHGVEGNNIHLCRKEDLIKSNTKVFDAWYQYESIKENFGKIPLISVLIPVDGNAHSAIDRIDSTLTQMANLEVIVSGTNDVLAPIHEKYQGKLKYNIVNPENVPFHAYSGLNHASGNILTVLGLGYRYTEDTLQQVSRIFSDYSNIQWISALPASALPASGREDLVNYAPFRINSSILEQDLRNNHVPDTLRRSFWRRSLWAKINTKTSVNSFSDAELKILIEFLNHSPNYSTAIIMEDLEGENEVISSLEITDFDLEWILGSLDDQLLE